MMRLLSTATSAVRRQKRPAAELCLKERPSASTVLPEELVPAMADQDDDRGGHPHDQFREAGSPEQKQRYRAHDRCTEEIGHDLASTKIRCPGRSSTKDEDAENRYYASPSRAVKLSAGPCYHAPESVATPTKVTPASSVSPRKLHELFDTLETESQGIRSGCNTPTTTCSRSRSGLCTPTRSTVSNSTRTSRFSGRSTVGKGALRYTKFAIEGFPGEKHAVLIPDDMPVTSLLFQQILEALRLEMPSMMLSGVGSLRHPSKLGTPQLLSCPDVAEIIDDSMEEDFGRDGGATSSSMLSKWCRPSVSVDDAGRETDRRNLLDSVLDRRVAATMRSIAEAASQTNTWTFTGPKVSNFEVVLQRGMERGESSLFSMVAAHMQDRAYMESEFSKELMQRLIDGSSVLSTKGATSVDPIYLPGDLWNQECNIVNHEFSKHGFDSWSFDDSDDARAKGHPLLQWPWPWAHLFLLFYRKDTDGRYPEEPDWKYATEQRFDWKSVPFQFDLLSSSGYVLIGGAAEAKRKLLQVMEAGRPAVIIENTPVIAKQASIFFSMARTLLADRPRLSSELKALILDGCAEQLGDDPTRLALLQALAPSKILKYIESRYDSSTVKAADRLQLSDIMCMLDLMRQRPQYAQQRVCVLDPLRDARMDQDVKQLFALFCCDDMGSLDHSQANRSTVLKAWGAHCHFYQAASRFYFLWLKLEVAISATILACSALGVAIVFMKLQDKNRSLALLMNTAETAKHSYILPQHAVHKLDIHQSEGVTYQFMNCLLVLLPLLAGVLYMLESHMGFCEKWRTSHMAGHQIVAEIHMYLGKVGPYSAHPSWSRHVFLQRLHELCTDWSLRGADNALCEADGHAEHFARLPKALENHVEMALGVARQPQHPGLWGRLCCPCRPRSRDARGARLLLEQDGERIVDRAAPINADAYIDMRLTPLIKQYQAKARVLCACRRWMGAAILLLLAGSSGLVSIGLTLWVPVPVALAAFLGYLRGRLAPPQASCAIDRALGMLKCLELRWHGRTLPQQRKEAAREQLIGRTETIALALVESLYQTAPLMLEEDKEAMQWLEGGSTFMSSNSAGTTRRHPAGHSRVVGPRLSAKLSSANLPEKAVRTTLTPISSCPGSRANSCTQSPINGNDAWLKRSTSRPTSPRGRAADMDELSPRSGDFRI